MIKKTDLKLIENIFKNYTIANKIFRMTNMVIENSFITKYKIAMFNNSPQEGIFVRHVMYQLIKNTFLEYVKNANTI